MKRLSQGDEIKTTMTSVGDLEMRELHGWEGHRTLWVLSGVTTQRPTMPVSM